MPSQPPTPPAAFRSALLFSEDAKLKAFSTPDSPNENPLNQPRAESPEAARPPSAQENLARYRQQAAAPPPPPSAKAVARQAAVVAAADERAVAAAAAAAEAVAKPGIPADVDSPHPMLPDKKTYTAGYKAGFAEGFAAGLRASVPERSAPDAASAPPPPSGTYVFHCSSETENECLDRRLLGCSYAMRSKVEGVVRGTPLVLYNIKTRRAYGPLTATGPPQRHIAKGAFGGRFDWHVAFDAGSFGLVFDAAVDAKGGKGPDIGLWTRWESGKGQPTKRRRAAPKKASP